MTDDIWWPRLWASDWSRWPSWPVRCLRTGSSDSHTKLCEHVGAIIHRLSGAPRQTTTGNPVNTKHLYNVGSTSKTLGRRCTNVIQMFCVCWEGVKMMLRRWSSVQDIVPTSQQRHSNVCRPPSITVTSPKCNPASIFHVGSVRNSLRLKRFNPLTAKLFNLNFHPLEVVSRWRDPQLQVSENYSNMTKSRSTVFKYCWLMSHFILNMFKRWY